MNAPRAHGDGYPQAEARNKRSVWTVTTRSYSGAHFATFPPDLIWPCILAGTSEKGCCAECGSPWERILERGDNDGRDGTYDATDTTLRNDGLRHSGRVGKTDFTTTGWQPTCKCHAKETVQCTVLDPFMGSGTTAQVALEQGRHALGIELNPEYCDLITRRLNPILEQELLFDA
jgi:hypothetical protein